MAKIYDNITELIGNTPLCNSSVAEELWRDALFGAAKRASHR